MSGEQLVRIFSFQTPLLKNCAKPCLKMKTSNAMKLECDHESIIYFHFAYTYINPDHSISFDI